MKLEDLMSLARDAISVGKVFGEPVERDGVTVIPAARIGGGGGAGRGMTSVARKEKVAALGWAALRPVSTSSRTTRFAGCPPLTSTGSPSLPVPSRSGT
jgi:hypothetical protein